MTEIDHARSGQKKPRTARDKTGSARQTKARIGLELWSDKDTTGTVAGWGQNLS